MLRIRGVLFLVGLLVASTAYARGATPKELVVDLKFNPQEGVHADSPALAPALLDKSVEIRVQDGRRQADPSAIGQGTGGDDKSFPIRSGTDVIAFVKDTLLGISKGWALKSQSPAERVLTLTLTSFSIDESNKALGSVYSTDVKLAFTLKDARGRTLAEGIGSGSTHRYGHAHSVENCNEVLSDALKEAYASVLADPGLQNAWISGKPAQASSQMTAKQSVEERLKELDALLKKGVITKEEYDKKRAEILKDL